MSALRPLPDEALYDLVFDPHEAHNLAEFEGYSVMLSEMRARLLDWLESTGDPLAQGLIPEPPVK
jgi:hypothetical protein